MEITFHYEFTALITLSKYNNDTAPHFQRYLRVVLYVLLAVPNLINLKTVILNCVVPVKADSLGNCSCVTQPLFI